MNASSAQTDRAIGKIAALAASAQSQADALNSQIAQMKRQADATGELVSPAQQSAKAAMQSAQTTRQQLSTIVYPALATVSDVRTGAQPNIAVSIKNSGQTTARDYAGWLVEGVRPYPLSAPLEVTPPVASVIDLPPNGVQTYTIKDDQLSQATIDALSAGTAAIYVYGEVTYTDAFGQRVLKPFRLLYGGGKRLESGIYMYSEYFPVAVHRNSKPK